MEEKIKQLQPDILIKFNDKNLFIIEVKTTIGWNRESIEGEFNSKMKQLSTTFDIPENNVVYIFQSPSNIDKKFRDRYLTKDGEIYKSKTLPEELPFNKIRPLMWGDDPFYINKKVGITSDKIWSENEITERSSERIVIPLEYTIKEIIAASEKIKS